MKIRQALAGTLLLAGLLARAGHGAPRQPSGFATNAAPALAGGILGLAGKQGSIGVFIGSSTVDSMAPFFAAARELDDAGLEVLAVFDLEDTLLAPAQAFPSSGWLGRELSALGECRPRLPAALLEERRRALLRVAGPARDASAWRLVPDDGSRNIRELQDRGVKTAILTSRSPDEKAATFRALRALDIDMTRNPLGRDFDTTFKRATSYRDGVFFTSGQPKDQMLAALLARGGCAPDVVLLIDDRAEHIDAVMRSMAGGRISYHGFRYAGAGGSPLDGGRARIQLKEFLDSGILLGDDAAEKLAAANPVSAAEANRLLYGVDDLCAPAATAAPSAE